MTEGVWPAVRGAASTPSGGTHEFVTSLSVGSRDGVLPGLDVKGGLPDDSSRGFAFIAPTVKRSKVTGEVAPYTWTAVPDLTRLHEPDPTVREIQELVRRTRGTRGPLTCEGPPRPHRDTTGAVPAGSRHHALLSYAGQMRHRGRADATPSGGGV